MKLIFWLGIIVLIIVTVPVIGVVVLGIAVTSGFPVLFGQKRVGKDGKLFIMYKFRTMILGAQRMQKKLQYLNEAHGPVFKLHNDPRYTSIGKFLAHTGLDELPQLYNILRGDMALFGPRPLPLTEERKLKGWQKVRERVKPGIFSPWILEGYHRTPFDVWMKSDIAYVKNKNFWYDLQLFIRALSFLFQLLGKEILAIVE
jgi:lipopolysaccharide/colanic/teichoic acid biosynthesis glycosyltransferase